MFLKIWFCLEITPDINYLFGVKDKSGNSFCIRSFWLRERSTHTRLDGDNFICVDPVGCLM